MTAEFEFTLEYVDDIESARAFYEGTLGMAARREHPTFVQYDHFAIASDERVGDGNEPELYWSVPDVDAAYKELAGRASIAVEMQEMPFGRVFAVRDPDGRARYLLEWAKRRPSEAA